MKTLKYLSLFSGIGGFELGLEQSKYEFECIGASEIDKYAKSIYFRHFPRHKDLGNASEIDPSELQDFELLVAGFPCQAFSLAGHRRGFDDTRGTLFFEIARILKEKKPRYLLLENVKGLLSHNKGRTFKKILGVLSELGYDVEWEVLNSKSFSVPQNRERVYFKGYFRAKCGGEILSQKRDSGEIDSEINSTEIHKVGNLSNTGHGGKNVYSMDGLSPTLCSDSVPKNGLNIVELKPVIFNRQVKKRIHSADYDELSEFLRKHKKNAHLTLNEISEKLDVKKTEVEHWFRTDKFFAPPPSEVWQPLKELLNIKDDKYDAFITEFELVDGVYDADKRAYDVTGISSTLNTKGESLIKVNIVGNVNPTKECQSGMVYDSDGLCRSLTATDGNHPTFIKVRGNLSSTGYMGEDVFDVNGISRTLNATNYKHPLRIVEENVEVEQVIGPTQKHSAKTDGKVCPTLTSAMGEGGGHIPMLKLKTNTSKGYDEVGYGDGVRLCHPTSTTARGRSQKDQVWALSTDTDWGTVDKDFRIRKLTPTECERLQAFPDGWTEYGKDGEKISDTQRYKCLGNAVTTNVITYIANTMFGGYFEG